MTRGAQTRASERGAASGPCVPNARWVPRALRDISISLRAIGVRRTNTEDMPGIKTVPPGNRLPAGEVWPKAHENRHRTNSLAPRATACALVRAAEAGFALCADGFAPEAKMSPFRAATAAIVRSSTINNSPAINCKVLALRLRGFAAAGATSAPAAASTPAASCSRVPAWRSASVARNSFTRSSLCARACRSTCSSPRT